MVKIALNITTTNRTDIEHDYNFSAIVFLEPLI